VTTRQSPAALGRARRPHAERSCADTSRLHDSQDVYPPRPSARKHDPECALDAAQTASPVGPQHRDLLPKRKVFGDQARPRAERRPEGSAGGDRSDPGGSVPSGHLRPRPGA
jgi:hypothetical protein